LNRIVLIDVSLLIATDVIVDGPKRAVLVGTVAGVQFALVFQSLVEGAARHVAFWRERQRRRAIRRQAAPPCASAHATVLTRA
jgi:hypothetical protein